MHTTQDIGYRTIADVAYDSLRQRILAGTLEPGERIDQDAEAGRLNASRMPVREALRRLETEGLVEILRHRGAIVRPLTIGDLEDLYVLRLALEGVAGRLGAERIQADALERMRDLLPPMEEVVARLDPAAWLDLDWTFHETLYRAANRPRLLRTIQGLREEAGRYRKVGLSLPNVLEVSLLEHRAIVEGCARRDGEEVESLIRGALERTLRELRDLFEHDASREADIASA